MPAETETPTKRKSAEQRREEVVLVAIKHFAKGGFAGTSTEAIAKDAGISHPYLFRLYRTKKELFLACMLRSNERIREAFVAAADQVPEGYKLSAMGAAYNELVVDRDALLMQMQGYTATSDPEIQAEVRRCMEQMVTTVREHSGVTEEELWRFFAHGMLMNVLASIDIEGHQDESDWARKWSNPSEFLPPLGPPDAPKC